MIKKLPKLLDVIKEKGLTHQEVLELIEKTDLPESQEDEADVPDEEVVEDDKPDEPIELYLTEVESEEEPEPEEEQEEQSETISLTPEELTIKIKEGVEEKLKANRKVPSKGKIVGKPQSDVPVVKKNWYEQMV